MVEGGVENEATDIWVIHRQPARCEPSWEIKGVISLNHRSCKRILYQWTSHIQECSQGEIQVCEQQIASQHPLQPTPENVALGVPGYCADNILLEKRLSAAFL